jgi:sortase B
VGLSQKTKVGFILKKLVFFLVCLILLVFIWFKTENLIKNNLNTLENKSDYIFKKENDVYAHLKVQGTNIDYPIAQHPVDDQYYLSHDIEHLKTIYGAIFTEKINKKDFKDPATIVYGHSTYDGSMFGSLEWFESSDFFDKNKKIEISTQNEKIDYEIFSAYSYTDDHLIDSFNLTDRTSISDYFQKIKKFSEDLQGNYRDISYSDSDKLLILSTCDIKNNERRFVVHAKEIKRVLVKDISKAK